MEFNINHYCESLKEELLCIFGDRLCYMGLQGSYLRGDATEKSDIDIMIILDGLTVKDMDLYRNILAKLGNSDRACGFICSKEDMNNWNPLEICQLKFTTKDIYGTLSNYLPVYTHDDEVNYVKLSLNNLCHALCHSYIHADREKLKNSLSLHYKSAFFILQNTNYLETGEFILTKTELTNRLIGKDKSIIETVILLDNGTAPDFTALYNRLFTWCQKKQREVK